MEWSTDKAGPVVYDKQGQRVPQRDAEGRKNSNYTRLVHAERVKAEAASLATLFVCVGGVGMPCSLPLPIAARCPDRDL